MLKQPARRALVSAAFLFACSTTAAQTVKVGIAQDLTGLDPATRAELLDIFRSRPRPE